MWELGSGTLRGEKGRGGDWKDKRGNQPAGEIVHPETSMMISTLSLSRKRSYFKQMVRGCLAAGQGEREERTD